MYAILGQVILQHILDYFETIDTGYSHIMVLMHFFTTFLLMILVQNFMLINKHITAGLKINRNEVIDL